MYAIRSYYDTRSSVHAIRTHLFELTDHRSSKKGDRVTDSGNHRVEMRDPPPTVGEIGLSLLEVDSEFQGIEHFYLVASGQCSLFETSG